MGGHRQVAAGELVLALGAGLDASQFLRDRELDGLVVADLEMQERVVLDRAPVAAVERVRADEIDGAGDPAAGALRHDQDDAVGHALADQRIELAGEVGAAPFARAGLHVEVEERVPGLLGQVAAGQPMHGDAVLQRVAALALDGLALARRQRLEESVERGVAGVLPMELLVGALQEALPRRGRRTRLPA